MTCDGPAIVPMIQAKVFLKHHEDRSCTRTMQSPLDLRHLTTLVALRESNPVSFTAPGQRLLKLADAVLPLVDDTERDVARLASGASGALRIAVECHTCFDWLMPSMD